MTEVVGPDNSGNSVSLSPGITVLLFAVALEFVSTVISRV